MKKFIRGFMVGTALIMAVAVVVTLTILLFIILDSIIGTFAIPVIVGLAFCTALGVLFATEPEYDVDRTSFYSGRLEK